MELSSRANRISSSYPKKNGKTYSKPAQTFAEYILSYQQERNCPKKKKEKDVKDIRSYLSTCTISKSGLIVRLKNIPMQAKPAELVVIPRMFAFTLAKALHVNLNHPSQSQMIKQFQKQFFALDERNLLKNMCDSCVYPCQASKLLPKELPT